MSSRLCDLEDIIDINKYLTELKAKSVKDIVEDDDAF